MVIADMVFVCAMQSCGRQNYNLFNEGTEYTVFHIDTEGWWFVVISFDGHKEIACFCAFWDAWLKNYHESSF